MSIVAQWSVRIAKRVTPDEIDFAAEVGEAYAAGGAERDALFPEPGAEPGGFGVTALVDELPTILRALADAAEVLRGALASRELGNVVAMATLVAALRGPQSARKGEPKNSAPPAPPAPRAEEIARELLAELMSDPESAREFLRRLSDGEDRS